MQTHQKAGFCRVNIDECGFSQDMPRQYGYAPVGQRCAGKQNGHAKGRTHVIGALLGSHLLTIGLFKGSINADVFSAWLAQDLLPQLPPRCVVVMDNAAFHKRADIRELCQQADHLLEYLPPYSLDLNPIEHKWAQAKAIRTQKNGSGDERFSDY
jgi:transposase